MAKNNNKTIANKITSVILGIIALALLAGIVTAVGIGSSGFKNWKVKTWFGSWGKNKNNTEAIIAVSDSQEALRAGGEYLMPARMTVMPLAEAAPGEYVPSGELTMTASLSNEFLQASFQFSADFMQTEDGWETDKNLADYITFTLEGSDSVRVSVIAPFGAPIELKATLSGTDRFATCRIDYLKRFDYNLNHVGIAQDSVYLSCKDNTQYKYTNDFGNIESVIIYLGFHDNTGTTLPDDIEVLKCTYEVCSGMQQEIQKLLNFEIQFQPYEVPKSPLTTNNGLSYSMKAQIPDYSIFIKDFESFNEQQKNAVYYAWYHGYLNAFKDKKLYNEMGLIADVEVEAKVSGANTGVIGTYYGRGGDLTGKIKGENIQPDIEFNSSVVF